MGEQMFPQVERVIYGKAPLAEVICQVRFPADLRIETEPPASFQQRIRVQFPLLKQTNRAFISAFPPELSRALESLVPATGSATIWQFSTEDGTHTLELLKENLTLISRNYHRWEDFYALLKGPLSAFGEIYRPAFLTRVGLRYRDTIQRSKLGLLGAPWSSLLKRHVLGELSEPDIEGRTIEAVRNLLLSLPERNAKVRLQHGFAEIEGSNEQSYLIDCDFFVERTEVNHADDTLQYFHSNAASYFRWCITEKLHNAMEPKPVVG